MSKDFFKQPRKDTLIGGEFDGDVKCAVKVKEHKTTFDNFVLIGFTPVEVDEEHIAYEHILISATDVYGIVDAQCILQRALTDVLEKLPDWEREDLTDYMMNSMTREFKLSQQKKGDGELDDLLQ